MNFSPAPIVSKELEKKKIKLLNLHYKRLKKVKMLIWFLYAGLMIKNNEPYIEYNIRMGDPECQVILPRLKTDIKKFLKSVTSNKLQKLKIEWKKQKCRQLYYVQKVILDHIKKIYRLKTLIRFTNQIMILFITREQKYFRKKFYQMVVGF